MNLSRKRAKVGDILEFAVPGGLSYVHYLGRHPLYGDAIAVSPEVYQRRPDSWKDLFAGGYVTFYPVQVAVRQTLVCIAGNMPSPGLPGRFRKPGRIKEGRVLNWSIVSEDGETKFRPGLSDEERRLPIMEVWGHEFLVHRISEGWRPEWEG